MAPVARFRGAGQDTQHGIRRPGERAQRIRARIGAATSELGIADPQVQPAPQPHRQRRLPGLGASVGSRGYCRQAPGATPAANSRTLSPSSDTQPDQLHT